MSPQELERFWTWFQENETAIIEAVLAFDHHWLDSELSARLRALAPALNWEIGPGTDTDWQFVVSPVDRGSLPHCRAIVSAAPGMARWKWHSCKPPKPSRPLDLEIVGDDGDCTALDASGWSYLLKRFDDGGLGILFVSDDLPETISQDNKQRAARLILENLIGEEPILERFRQVSLVQESALPDSAPVSAIDSLVDHLTHLGVIGGGPRAAPAP